MLVICKTLGVSLADLRAHLDSRRTSFARRVCLYWLRRVAGVGKHEAARMINRTASCVCPGVRHLQYWIDENPSEAERLFAEIGRRMGLEPGLIT